MHAELCDEIQAVRIKNLPEKFSDTKYLQEADAREPSCGHGSDACVRYPALKLRPTSLVNCKEPGNV